jgi:hypothetical protein
MIMNENIFRTGPPAWSLRAAERVDGSGAPGSSADGIVRRLGRGVLAGPLGELAVDEDRAGPDERDQVVRWRSGGSGLVAAGSRMSTQQAVNYAAADGAGLLAGK